MKVARYERRRRRVDLRWLRAIIRARLDEQLRRLAEKHGFRELPTLPRPRRFQPGDIVTRAGDDLQLVLDVTEDFFCMTVRCIRAPASGWCKVGDEEYNLCRRYDYAALPQGPGDEDRGHGDRGDLGKPQPDVDRCRE